MRDADDEQECCGREDLAQVGGSDEAEDRPHEESTGGDDADDDSIHADQTTATRPTVPDPYRITFSRENRADHGNLLCLHHRCF